MTTKADHLFDRIAAWIGDQKLTQSEALKILDDATDSAECWIVTNLPTGDERRVDDNHCLTAAERNR